MILEGKKINLRKLKASDAASIARHANHKNIARFLRSSFPSPYRLKDAEKWIRKVQAKWRQGKEYHLGVEDCDTQQIIGLIGITKINKYRNAELGYWLGKRYWGKGIMTEAVGLMLGFAFKDIKLNKVYANVFHPNKASAILLERNGFKREGVIRKQVKRGSRWYNLLVYGILKKEFQKLES